MEGVDSMKYKIIMIIHICLLILAGILLFCRKMDPGFSDIYSDIIYAISIGKDMYDFNTFIFANLCSFILSIIDSISIIFAIAKLGPIKKILYWLIMDAIAIVSSYVFLRYYYACIT